MRIDFPASLRQRHVSHARTHRLFLLLMVMCLCSSVSSSFSATTAPGDFKPTWDSLSSGYRCPDWYRDAKLGIYFHWGVYSVPAFGSEWYSRNMYQPGHADNKHHLATYGPLDKFGYKDFIPRFKAEKFDADAWVDLFVQAGARYAGPVAEHADGFSMWDSKVNPWNAAAMGPRRDIVGELARAVRKRNLKFFTSFHHSWLWGWYATPDKTADVYNPAFAAFYWPLPVSAFDYTKPQPAPSPEFVRIWSAKLTEVVDRYQPDLVYFDSRLSIINERARQEFLAYYYNQARRAGREVVVTYKGRDMAPGAALLDIETGRLATIQPAPWQTDDVLDWNSWAYLEHPNYKPATRVVQELIDIVSKNGNLLLDIGPRPDGTIPDPVRERLLAIGAWLKMNGEAIYGTRPYKIFGEGPTVVTEGFGGEAKTKDFTPQDIRFTTRGEVLYVLCLGTPRDRVVIKSLGRDAGIEPRAIDAITLLGSAEKISWSQEAGALTLTCPATLPCAHALAFKVTFKK